MVGWASATVSAAAAMIPRKPKSLSRQVALLAVSHQIRMSRQHNIGPNTATIQYFEAPSSNSAGPNRAANIRTTRSTAGQVRNERNFRGSAVSVIMVSSELLVESFMTYSLVEHTKRSQQAI